MSEYSFEHPNTDEHPRTEWDELAAAAASDPAHEPGWEKAGQEVRTNVSRSFGPKGRQRFTESLEPGDRSS